MSQLDPRADEDFEETLRCFMLARGLRSRAEAIQVAVREALARETAQRPLTDFASWRGRASNPRPRSEWQFADDDALWEGEG